MTTSSSSGPPLHLGAQHSAVIVLDTRGPACGLPLPGWQLPSEWSVPIADNEPHGHQTMVIESRRLSPGLPNTASMLHCVT